MSFFIIVVFRIRVVLSAKKIKKSEIGGENKAIHYQMDYFRMDLDDNYIPIGADDKKLCLINLFQYN
ncbi:hypothetical protein D0T85_10225 [Bacteroides sp. 519]|nr:hypothetical protein [Bacteroides sp. 519]